MGLLHATKSLLLTPSALPQSSALSREDKVARSGSFVGVVAVPLGCG